jgi:hypothetical protein
MAGASGSLIDASGNSWTIVGGVATMSRRRHLAEEREQPLVAVEWNRLGNQRRLDNQPAAVGPAGASPPDIISVSAGGQTETMTSGIGTGVIQATLGASDTFVQFTGNGGVQLTGGSGGSIIAATSGTNSFTMGSGPMDITGGTGAYTYIVHAGSGFLAIEDFAASKGDTLAVDNSLSASMQTGSDGLGGTLISFGGNAAIDIRHVANTAAVLLISEGHLVPFQSGPVAQSRNEWGGPEAVIRQAIQSLHRRWP